MNYQNYKSNCHTHSVFCDGINTIEDMAKEAYERGFYSLGFSGHSPLPYENDWAMKHNELGNYINKVLAVKEKYKGQMDVICGIELDFDSRDIDLTPFKYIINSIHTLNYKGHQIPIDTSAALWKAGVETCFDGNMMTAIREYYDQAYKSAIRKEGNIAGHFDLVTKFNHVENFFDQHSAEYLNIAKEAIDGVCDMHSDIIFEVNMGALPRTGKKTPYPQDELLCHLNNRGARVTVTSDCHDSRFLEIGYDIAFDAIRRAGFKSVWIISEKGFEEISIGE